jgi:hypothetical protein
MDLYTRAKDVGIQTEFMDGQGHRHVTDTAALQIILDALPARTPTRLLKQAVVIRSGLPARTELDQAATLPLRWKIVAGLEVIAEGESADGVIAWPPGLPEGSYLVHLTDAAAGTESAIDRRAAAGLWRRFRPLLAAGGPALWHPIGAQLRIGDFTDLEGLIELAAAWEPMASVSIRCMRCSMTVRVRSVPIRRTAGCFSTRSISTSKNSLNFNPTPSLGMPPRSPGCERATSSTMRGSPN